MRIALIVLLALAPIVLIGAKCSPREGPHIYGPRSFFSLVEHQPEMCGAQAVYVDMPCLYVHCSPDGDIAIVPRNEQCAEAAHRAACNITLPVEQGEDPSPFWRRNCAGGDLDPFAQTSVSGADYLNLSNGCRYYDLEFASPGVRLDCMPDGRTLVVGGSAQEQRDGLVDLTCAYSVRWDWFPPPYAALCE